ncbi:D-lactate dehydrogenase cytochrome oxidoreductase [Mycena floridula]|nr:D-lactate dehydrogenase cytochrome oxidoreductase [Mycena floridula]
MSRPWIAAVRRFSTKRPGIYNPVPRIWSKESVKPKITPTASLPPFKPYYARHNPWSNDFQGSPYLKIIIQSACPKDAYASSFGIKSTITLLQNAFPDDEDAVVTDPDVLQAYGASENSYHPASPHSVVEDVVKILKIATDMRMPVVVYSGATSLEGHYFWRSICVDMVHMDKIIQINEADSDLICQSGARWEDINLALKEKGIPLFFPLDPGPGATIGGMVATGCSGTNAVRYGTAKAEWFLNLTVVLPNGEVIKTRQRARKSSAGFDTTKLFIGAEGTLGIVTEATLRLAPLLPTKVAMAVEAVQEILNTPYGPHIQCVELLDDNMMNAINKGGFADHPYPVKDTLFFKIQGDDKAKHGSTSFEFAATDHEAEVLWSNRRYALMSTMASYPGSRCWTTDVCVPVSRLPQLVEETKTDLKEAGLRSCVLGHVGDGNFHALILFNDEKELETVSQAVHRLVHRAIALEGTCTGEHGVGVGKKEYLVKELGEGTVNLMRTVKNAIDPLNILNPGKLYPDEPSKP